MMAQFAPNWSFFNPTRVHFGFGSRSVVADLVKDGRTLVVTSPRGRKQFENDPLLGTLVRNGHAQFLDIVQPNPGLTDFNDILHLPGASDINSIIGFGGGSAIDAAKAVAALFACRGSAHGLRHIIQNPKILDTLPVPPLHALPTTAGTGSEVTPFATIWDHEVRKKMSLTHAALFPRTAIVDAELSCNLPRETTLATGLDALNQAFESVWNRNASPYTLKLAALAIERGIRALPLLAEDCTNRGAREAMAEASLLAGLCISQTRTAICHSISYPLTAHFGIAHGFACAFSMSAVAHEVLNERPDVLERVAVPAGFSGAKEMVLCLDRLLDADGVRAAWLTKIDSPMSVRALADEMTTPGRSDNFVLPIDQSRLMRLIDSSLA